MESRKTRDELKKMELRKAIDSFLLISTTFAPIAYRAFFRNFFLTLFQIFIKASLLSTIHNSLKDLLLSLVLLKKRNVRHDK